MPSRRWRPETLQLRGVDMRKPFGHETWSLSQIEFLKKNYQKQGQSYCAVYLHKTENAVRCKARKMHLQDSDSAWTPTQLEILEHHWKFCSFREMLMALPGRTAMAIKKKAAKQKLGPRLQGMITAIEGCRLLGVCQPEFRRIVQLGNVTAIRNRSLRVLRYDREQVIAAGKDYFRRETGRQAATRLQWNYERLRTAASKLGAAKTGDEYKLYPEEWDALCQQWETRVKDNYVAAAKRLRESYHVKSVEQAKKILEERGYIVSPAPCTARTSTSQDTGSGLSTS